MANNTFNKKIADMDNLPVIAKEKFQFAQRDGAIHDTKLETKPIGYFKDAMSRFKKNKSSVVAAFIILFLVIYSIVVPIAFANNYNTSLGDNLFLEYGKLLPKADAFSWAGWDGCKNVELGANDYNIRRAIGVETGLSPIVTAEKFTTVDETNGKTYTKYRVKLDTYYDLGMYIIVVNKENYKAIMSWQDEHQIQVIFPAVDYKAQDSTNAQRLTERTANIWYKCNDKGVPTLDQEGNFQNIYKISNGSDNYSSLRLESDPGTWAYAAITGAADMDENGNIIYDADGFPEGGVAYKLRVCKYTYFQYIYGIEPSFVFGTNSVGQDIFYRLAQGAQFSFMLAVSVSAINLTIGAIYGAIEGYFGGAADMLMERIRDVLGGIPFTVLTTLFQLHFADKVGVVGALLFAFVATGWLGMAGTVRMQFYRFKNQEYILSARTLGAKDSRIMFKHILPNALGTIVTSCVLVIPGVIFSESSLTYLGIINLESSRWTSVGTMLALGRDYLSNYPHIILFPALFISMLEISFNLFGNGLRDAFNPSLRGSEG